MIDNTNLDPREQEIYASADEWWATRFKGRGVYDKIGPFTTELEARREVMEFFRKEEQDYPPPATIYNRPFALYASSSRHGGSHVIVGTVHRDGKHHPTSREVSKRTQAERAAARTQSRNRRNTERPDQV